MSVPQLPSDGEKLWGNKFRVWAAWLLSMVNERAEKTHTHSIAQVTNLNAKLDDKADVAHNHVFADISGLAALNSKNTANTNAINALAKKVDAQPEFGNTQRLTVNREGSIVRYVKYGNIVTVSGYIDDVRADISPQTAATMPSGYRPLQTVGCAGLPSTLNYTVTVRNSGNTGTEKLYFGIVCGLRIVSGGDLTWYTDADVSRMYFSITYPVS